MRAFIGRSVVPLPAALSLTDTVQGRAVSRGRLVRPLRVARPARATRKLLLDLDHRNKKQRRTASGRLDRCQYFVHVSRVLGLDAFLFASAVVFRPRALVESPQPLQPERQQPPGRARQQGLEGVGIVLVRARDVGMVPAEPPSLGLQQGSDGGKSP